MDLGEAIRSLTPLQLQIPDPRRPLQLKAHCVAEAFLVETEHGPAVVWLEAFWCKDQAGRAARIAYARPHQDGSKERWIDQDPRYGPHCLGYQRPVIIERLSRESPAWRDYRAWQLWRASQGSSCGRRCAWQRVEQELGASILQRMT
jgi:hypothetical protein